MQIYVNGEQTQVPERFDMAALLALLDLTEVRLAVEVNEELVPRSTFADTPLSEGDKIEIIHAVGGG